MKNYHWNNLLIHILFLKNKLVLCFSTNVGGINVAQNYDNLFDMCFNI